MKWVAEGMKKTLSLILLMSAAMAVFTGSAFASGEVSAEVVYEPPTYYSMSDPALADPITGKAPGGTEYIAKLDLAYVDNARAQQRLDVFVPAGEAPENGWPVVIDIPGGGFFVCVRDQFDKDATYGNEYRLGALDNGFALIAVSYRSPIDYRGIEADGGISEDMYEDRTELAMLMAEDVKTALRYITQNAAALGINPDQLILIGDSAGSGLAGYIAYGQDDFEGYRIRGVAGFAAANHDVWADKDWSHNAEMADEEDVPYYLSTGTHDVVCTAADRGIGFANLLLSKGVNVTFEIMPDAVHMNADVDNNFFARAIELGRQNIVWGWAKSVLDDELPDAPKSYELTYEPETIPDVEEKAMLDMEPLVEAIYS